VGIDEIFVIDLVQVCLNWLNSSTNFHCL